jgi:hypothetical protein
MYSQVLPFWTCSITPVQCEIDQATWIENVLPGLGYDRLRLLELTFPPPLPDHTSAARQFDKAKIAFDQRRYGDCILECRGLLTMWEKQLSSTRNNLVADIVKGGRKGTSDVISSTRSGRRSGTLRMLLTIPKATSMRNSSTQETHVSSCC